MASSLLRSPLLWKCFAMQQAAVNEGLRLPALPAVYIVYTPRQVLYVGQTSNLAARWKGHSHAHLFPSYAQEMTVAWEVIPDASRQQRLAYESQLMACLSPTLNTHGNPASHQTNHLKALREARGISRYAFARTLGVDPSTLWRWEQDATVISSRDLMKIAEHLHVAATDIVPELNAVRHTAAGVEEVMTHV